MMLRQGTRAILREGNSHVWKRNYSSSSFFHWRKSSRTFPSASTSTTSSSLVGMSLLLMAGTANAVFMDNNSTILCQPEQDDRGTQTETQTQTVEQATQPIPEEWCTYDTYNGVIVTLPEEPIIMDDDDDGWLLLQNEAELEKSLSRSLEIWKESGKRGIWIHSIPHLHVQFYPLLVQKFGFQFHQSASYQKTVVMTKWLPTHEPSRLPHGPTHQVGVGIIAFHPSYSCQQQQQQQQPNKRKILVVQEKSGPAAVSKLWKMPTGLVDPGEDIAEAAIRELKEETGISCPYHLDRIVGFRQAHPSPQYPNRPSDLFFLCLVQLTPQQQQEEEIQFQPQEDEIADIQWMTIDDYMNQPLWKDSPLFQAMHQVLYDLDSSHTNNPHNDNNHNNKQEQSMSNSKNGRNTIGFVSKKLPLVIRPGFQTVYVHDQSKL